MEPIVSIAVPSRGTGHARHVTPKATGVEWTETANGCETAKFTLADPATAVLLSQDCRVVLSDPRSGDVLWTGDVARDGVQRSPLGDSATVRCIGNVGDLHASYWSLPYVVKDPYSDWERETIQYRSATNWTTTTGARPDDPPWDAVVISCEEGKNCYPGEGGRMAYLGHYASDMYIGAISFSLDHGTGQNPDRTTPTQLRTEMFVGDQFWGNRPVAKIWDTASVDYHVRAAWYGGGESWWPEWPNVHDQSPRDNTENYLVLRTRNERTAGVETTSPDVWMAASRMVIIGQRVNRWGEHIGVPGTRLGVTQVNAGEIVEDLVGRCLRGVIDPTLLTTQHTSDWNLEQADYREPSAPGEILDDLTSVHPDHLWRVGMRSPTTGLAPMEWRPWGTTARYIIDETAEVDMDGSPDPLYNRVTVRWVDWKGRPRSDSFDANPTLFPDIADLQGVHEAPPINLDTSLGAAANVARIANKKLEQVARRVPGGTVTVTRPVLDTTSQVRVPPSQIEAGSTCAFTWDEPQVVHRVQEVAHAGIDEAQLSFGRSALSLDQIVATRGHGRK